MLEGRFKSARLKRSRPRSIVATPFELIDVREDLEYAKDHAAMPNISASGLLAMGTSNDDPG